MKTLTINTPALRCSPRRLMLAIGATAAMLSQTSAWAFLPIEHWEQANGAKVWLVQSPSLPMVHVKITFDAGERRESASQAGLAWATAALLTRGTKASATSAALNEDQLDDAWADLGAEFSVNADNDSLQFSLRSLTDAELLEGAVKLASQQIGHPAWPAAVWQRERQRWIASINESRTRADTLASEAFAQAVYGNHPYGHITTAQTLGRISTKNMQEFYAAWVKACQATVTVVGNIDKAQADTIVTALLADLPHSTDCTTAPAVADIAPLTNAEQININFPSEQTTIVVGQPGIKRNDPDFFAMLVGNHILGGGGFTSRLMNEVREKRGLVYGVYSDFTPGRHAGAFFINLQTRNAQADEALQLVRKVTAEFVQNGPTEEELSAAKANLIGGFALRLDSNAKLLSNITNIAWNNLPLDYLDTWSDKVAKLTTDDIRQAFQRHIQPETMVTVRVGQMPAAQ